VSPRATALMDFFIISASSVQDKKQKKAEKELAGLIKQKTRIDEWVFEPYLSWLENCSCSAESKTKLSELVNKMKELGQQ